MSVLISENNNKLYSPMRTGPALVRQNHRQPSDHGGHSRMRSLLPVALGATLVLAFLPEQASAHIKWFEPYDVSAVPASADQVISTQFVLILLGFTVLVFAGFLLDRLLAPRGGRLVGAMLQREAAETLLRAGMGGFFMALFATGGVILTPELKSNADWLPWLQVGIAISLLSRRTCVLGGIGILLLYSYGVVQYGIFHLADYPMFLGVAVYLGLTSSWSERLRALRMPVLGVSICIGLMWGAVEKWAYPQWTIPLLEARPYLTMGVPPRDVMIIAGFVEFSLAFYIMTGLSLVRLAILGLVMIFSAAILDFGKIDAIGHLPIVVPLLAMFVHGPNQVNRWFYDASAGLMTEARKASVGFATSMCLLFAAYYGIQSAEYGHAAGRDDRVGLQRSSGLPVAVSSVVVASPAAVAAARPAGAERS
ncbi:hypothetical protein [Rhodopila sp.]|uniref:hypothetical protein n=1 Tax=Rhodopila sp. TaxID=2480087 RepID=UPI003D0F900C